VVHDFIDKIMALYIETPFSVTSWIRTKKRNNTVGGNSSSYHKLGLAVDIVCDYEEDITTLINNAKRLGLGVCKEGDHKHIQAVIKQ
jgi:uncharacterized protein YcbK (DUF882 family)